jgi:hypothetical protein
MLTKFSLQDYSMRSLGFGAHPLTLAGSEMLAQKGDPNFTPLQFLMDSMTSRAVSPG